MALAISIWIHALQAATASAMASAAASTAAFDLFTAALPLLIDAVMAGAFLALACSAFVSFATSRAWPFAWLALTCLVIALFQLTADEYGASALIPALQQQREWAEPLVGSGAALLFVGFVVSLARREAASIPILTELAVATLSLVALNLSALWLPPEFGELALPITMLVCGGFVVLFLRLQGIAPMAGVLGLSGLAALFGLVQNLDAVEALLDRSRRAGWSHAAAALPGLLTGLVNLTVLTLWFRHVSNQGLAARAMLAKWQAKEHLRLSREVARQTAALNQALAYAQEKNRQKIQTLGYVGHDLRAPLATILGYVRLLRASAQPPKSEHLDAIERSVAYQLTLIDDVLDYAKAELQPLHLSPTPTNLAALLEDIAPYAGMLAQANRNRYVYLPPPFLPARVEVDGHRLQQVLLNLLSNATKFTLRGTVRLKVFAQRLPDTPRWRLRFCVEDEGVGIDLADQGTIFDAFTQLERTSGGVGLGLFIAERIVEGMGSRLSLASVLGEGSTFSFEIEVPELDGSLVPARRYEQGPAASEPQAAARVADMSAPPSPARLELALLARDGRLTDIEEWLQRIAHVHPGFDRYYEEVRKAVLTLDLARLETLALQG